MPRKRAWTCETILRQRITLSEAARCARVLIQHPAGKIFAVIRHASSDGFPPNVGATYDRHRFTRRGVALGPLRRGGGRQRKRRRRRASRPSGHQEFVLGKAVIRDPPDHMMTHGMAQQSGRQRGTATFFSLCFSLLRDPDSYSYMPRPDAYAPPPCIAWWHISKTSEELFRLSGDFADVAILFSPLVVTHRVNAPM
ncbi:hypothetical protein EVAR_74244_1 [Eumeta japonica]|uniref:Uncharacterized protein n=1 Tax=Eumeta variegata TaxID=151549 RepID=A0A4C1SER2_EUMVA|nr:hypothetical protein EVAR_74244_1 [Eumeta japonica]